jgi:hypothetical protein
MSISGTAADPRLPGLAVLPLLLAIASTSLQLLAAGTPFALAGFYGGLAVGLCGVILGHVMLRRIKKDSLPRRPVVGIGVVLAYLSLLTIPIIGFGILILVGYGH